MHVALGKEETGRRLEVELNRGFFGWIKILRLEVSIAQFRRPTDGRTQITIDNDPCPPPQAIRMLHAYKMGRLIKFVFRSGRTIFINRRTGRLGMAATAVVSDNTCQTDSK